MEGVPSDATDISGDGGPSRQGDPTWTALGGWPACIRSRTKLPVAGVTHVALAGRRALTRSSVGVKVWCADSAELRLALAEDCSVAALQGDCVLLSPNLRRVAGDRSTRYARPRLAATAVVVDGDECIAATASAVHVLAPSLPLVVT